MLDAYFGSLLALATVIVGVAIAYQVWLRRRVAKTRAMMEALKRQDPHQGAPQ